MENLLFLGGPILKHIRVKVLTIYHHPKPSTWLYFDIYKANILGIWTHLHVLLCFLQRKTYCIVWLPVGIPEPQRPYMKTSLKGKIVILK